MRKADLVSELEAWLVLHEGKRAVLLDEALAQDFAARRHGVALRMVPARDVRVESLGTFPEEVRIEGRAGRRIRVTTYRRGTSFNPILLNDGEQGSRVLELAGDGANFIASRDYYLLVEQLWPDASKTPLPRIKDSP